MQPEPAIAADSSLVSAGDQVRMVSSSASPAVLPIFGVMVVTGLLLFGIMTMLFPLVTPTEDQLKPFPPDEVAVAREWSFAQGRLFNPLIAISACAFVLSLVLPQVPRRGHTAAKPALVKSALWALVAAVLSGLGVTLAWLFTEYVTLPASYSMLRTVLGHCLEVSFFAAAVSMAVGANTGEKGAVADYASRGFLIGFLAAIVFDMVVVLAPRTHVDSLFPGGVIWGSRDPVALASWIGVLLLSVLLTVLGVGRKRQPAAKI